MKNLIPILILVLVIISAIFYFGQKRSTTISKATATPIPTINSGPLKEFTVKGANYSYDVKEIKVAKGDHVKINFVNAEGFHDINLDEFNAHSKKISANSTDTLDFTADKTGTFEYYCSVGKHRAMGMVGNLIVQ